MGREIKFRGLIRFGKDSGNWKYVILGEGAIGTAMSDLSIYLNNEDCLISSLSQFTGLKDKNGKEIYEGDVCSHTGDIATIVFWEGSFIFNKYYIHDYALTNFACCRTFEIIGNIHENPELLK